MRRKEGRKDAEKKVRRNGGRKDAEKKVRMEERK